MKDSEIDFEYIEPTDPDEFCVNCGTKILGVYRACPFCGKAWYVNEYEN